MTQHYFSYGDNEQSPVSRAYDRKLLLHLLKLVEYGSKSRDTVVWIYVLLLKIRKNILNACT